MLLRWLVELPGCSNFDETAHQLAKREVEQIVAVADAGELAGCWQVVGVAGVAVAAVAHWLLLVW